jgi:thioredoxin reductase (NADPH)
MWVRLSYGDQSTRVFAAGDVRSGSVKRVASAIGEGAMAMSFVHTHIGRNV